MFTWGGIKQLPSSKWLFMQHNFLASWFEQWIRAVLDKGNLLWATHLAPFKLRSGLSQLDASVTSAYLCQEQELPPQKQSYSLYSGQSMWHVTKQELYICKHTRSPLWLISWIQLLYLKLKFNQFFLALFPFCFQDYCKTVQHFGFVLSVFSCKSTAR